MFNTFKKLFLKRHLKRGGGTNLLLKDTGYHRKRIEHLIHTVNVDWLDEYRQVTGAVYHFETIHGNIEKLHFVVNQALSDIMDNRTLHSSIFKGGNHTRVVSVDDWLETNRGEHVDIKTGWQTLVQEIDALFNALNGLESANKRIAVERKLKYVYIDIINSMEALVKAVFKVHEQKGK